ncbi:hypothetical protein N7463_002387 [Penicillium fimorum]|uniref:aspartate--tRNA ligase n=1 Tax=Penicillium fimorum TaxID=1882269 RepID=A0A9W9Y0C6_9EURO|nr:hypothetical protein N7463_002387 [Penicillium fimorum]
MTRTNDSLVATTSKGEQLAFDARIISIITSEWPEPLILELRTDDGIMKANVDLKLLGETACERLKRVNPESLVHVTGHMSLSPDVIPGANVMTAEDQKDPATSKITHTINVTGLTIIAQACSSLPSFRRNELNLGQRLDNRILDLRNAGSGAILKLHSGMCQLIVEFLGSNGFHWIHAPRIISHTVTGDKEYFHLPYFGSDAWLAQNSQYQNQMVLSMDMQRVFDIGPAFRAETKSRTSGRHLTEFTVLGTGMVFQEDYHEVVDMMESMILFVFKGLQEREQYRNLIETVKKYYPTAREFRVGLNEQGKVPRISFLQAKHLLREELDFNAVDDQDLTEEEEAALGRLFRTSPHLGQTDVFTIDQYPASCRPFNSHASPSTPGLANAWDTIVGGREVCSGSQRINIYEEVCEAMISANMRPDCKEWQPYLSAFKAGMPPHGGLGLGVNRLLQGFLGLDDVREVTLFPRDVNRIAP